MILSLAEGLGLLAKSNISVLPAVLWSNAGDYCEIPWEPSVVRGSVRDVAHKTEAGLVRLGVSADDVPDAVNAVFTEATKAGYSLDAIVVNPMIDIDFELLTLSMHIL